MEGYWFKSGMRGGCPVSVPYPEALYLVPRIKHYYRRHEIEYISLSAFWWGRLSGKAYRISAGAYFHQAWFNRKKLVRDERLDFLRFVYQKTLADPRYRVDELVILREKYGESILDHPECIEVSHYYGLLIASFVETNDLVKEGSSVRLGPKALYTLSKAEEENRRHRDAVIYQRILLFLTLGLVVSGFLQVSNIE